MSRNQKKSGHLELYTFPKKVRPVFDDERYKRIVLASINDLNGQINPEKIEVAKARDEFNPAKEIFIGGITGLKAYFDILKQEYKDELVTLDAGSFLPKNGDIEETLFYYNYLNLDVVNLGTNELNLETKYQDYGFSLQKLFRKVKSPVLSNNIYDLSKSEKVDWKLLKEPFIKEFNKLKIGFIGVHSPQLAQKYENKKLNGIYFQNMAKIVIESSNKLRREGAHIIVLLAYHGINCTKIEATNTGITEKKVNFNPTDITGCESQNNDLVTTLSLLPPQKVDFVISGGGVTKVNNHIYDFPVMQNYGGGQFISWAELYYDTKLERVVSEKTVIHHPIQICHQFLDKTNDCFFEDGDQHNEIIPASFLNTQINILPLPRK